MMKRLMALMLAAAMALTLTPPRAAQAGNEDLAKVIVGGVILYGIAKAIEDEQRRKRRATVHVTPPKQYEPKKPAPVAHRKHLPRGCIFTMHTSKGQRTFFGQNCLNRHYRHAHRLPQACHRSHWTSKGWRYGYGRKCLRNHGYAW
ncbi:MAG: hypothetical protein ACU0CO_15400 [Shimia sp.]